MPRKKPPALNAHDFKPGFDARRNIKGPEPLPESTKILRKLNQERIQEIVDKMLTTNVKSYAELRTNPDASIAESLLFDVMERVRKHGDYGALGFLFENVRGKLPDIQKVDVSGHVDYTESKTLAIQILDQLTQNKKELP